MATFDYNRFHVLANKLVSVKYGVDISVEKKTDPDTTWKQLVDPDGSVYWYNTVTEATSSTKPTTVTTNYTVKGVLDNWDYVEKQNSSLIQEGDGKLIIRSTEIIIEIGDKLTLPSGQVVIATEPINSVNPNMGNYPMIQEVNIRGMS